MITFGINEMCTISFECDSTMYWIPVAERSFMFMSRSDAAPSNLKIQAKYLLCL